MTTTTIKFSRADYMANKCSHQEYYNQFVTRDTLALVEDVFGVEKLKAAYAEDKNLNTIPLAKWDALAGNVNTNEALKQAGDYLTLAGSVCILKAAARQLIN